MSPLLPDVCIFVDFLFLMPDALFSGDETFDLSVDKPLWLMISIRDRALIGKHDTVGRAYLCLDPKRFGDFLTHDLWMDLDSQGRILLRVSMEGEKDDIQFYFGRAFRSLKRAEADMVRIFIDKVRQLIYIL
jgi:rubrerythrin